MRSILHVIPSMNPKDGGPVTAVRDNVEAVRGLGVECEIVCLDAPEASWLQGLPCKVTAVGEGSGPFRANSRLRDWMVENSDRFDTAVVHGLWLYPTRCAAAVNRITGLPYCVFTHGMLDPAHRHTFPFRHLKKSLWWLACERQVLAQAQAIFFTSDVERDLARATFWPRLDLLRARIVPYSVMAPPDEAETQTSTFLDAHPALRGKRLLLFLSRIHPKKGVDLLLEAFAAVQGMDPRLHLVIAGPGDESYITSLKRQADRFGIADRTSWPGMLLGNAKWGALRAAELFCLPSHQENFGIVIAESLACGTPVLITHRVNIAPVIQRGDAGFVSEDTCADVTEKLKSWLSLHLGEQARSRENARRTFQRDFQAEAAAQKFLDALPRRRFVSHDVASSANSEALSTVTGSRTQRSTKERA